MAKSLSLVFACLKFSQASRSTASPADEAPLAGDQMIQIKAHDGTKATWQTVASGATQSCNGKIATWNSKATTLEECKQSCLDFTKKPCGAVYFFEKPDGTRICRLYQTCDKCKKQAWVGTTLTLSDQICTVKCVKSDCRYKDGLKTKSDFEGITCATPVCTRDECCDWLPGKGPTTLATTTTTTAALTYCGFTSGNPVGLQDAQCASGMGLGCTTSQCHDEADCDNFCNACGDCGGYHYDPSGPGGYRCWMKHSSLAGAFTYTDSYTGSGWKLRINNRSPGCNPTAAPATCLPEVGGLWCTRKDMTKTYEDCNEDGVLDMVCNAENGQRWIALSGDCKSKYNSGSSIPCSEIPKVR